MEKLIEKLTNPFDGLKKNNLTDFQAECKKIAEDLFRNYCINCNGTEYYFAEIEFYYYDSEQYLQNREQYKWQKVTYPRKCKAGQLFYHLSGVDICFGSDYDDRKAKFGGILIRAIKKDGMIIAGPLNCKDEILNTCNGGKMPELLEATKKRNLNPKQTYRALGKNDIDIENDRLCFYDSHSEWNPNKEKYNTQKGKIEFRKSTYKTDRFNENNK
jgi:hypothetical protein